VWESRDGKMLVLPFSFCFSEFLRHRLNQLVGCYSSAHLYTGGLGHTVPWWRSLVFFQIVFVLLIIEISLSVCAALTSATPTQLNLNLKLKLNSIQGQIQPFSTQCSCPSPLSLSLSLSVTLLFFFLSHTLSRPYPNPAYKPYPPFPLPCLIHPTRSPHHDVSVHKKCFYLPDCLPFGDGGWET